MTGSMAGSPILLWDLTSGRIHSNSWQFLAGGAVLVVREHG